MPNQPKTIMVAEDSPSMLAVVTRVLEGAGYKVVGFENGLDAITYARKNRVDLVITDLNMPEMNGERVVMSLKQNKEYSMTPILVMTSESSVDTKADFRKLGAQGWIQKPLNPTQLLTAISTTLSKH
jgi:two-component system, chemotaxis family, chemotaxis protein CheY